MEPSDLHNSNDSHVLSQDFNDFKPLCWNQLIFMIFMIIMRKPMIFNEFHNSHMESYDFYNFIESCIELIVFMIS